MRQIKSIFRFSFCIFIMAAFCGCAAKDARSAQDKIYEWEFLVKK